MGTKRSTRWFGFVFTLLPGSICLVKIADEAITHEEEWEFVEGVCLSTCDVSARSATFAPAS